MATSIVTFGCTGLFNPFPSFDDPQTIILDDAHGGESYIASMWSITISRSEHQTLYHKVTEIFEGELPKHFVRTIQESKRPLVAPIVEKIPTGYFLRHIDALREELNKGIANREHTQFYPWTIVRTGLHACHMYVSWDSILIRPYIVPSLTHLPFARANQRLYMSATLGSGGELERIAGVRKIERIPTPKTYATRGVGRRLFIFPDMIAKTDSYEPWLAGRLSSTKRTLTICPTYSSLEHFRTIIEKSSPTLATLTSQNIQESLDSFTGSDHAVLLLANRYDGIDLPNEECRQLIIYGLPSGTNAQEAFLEDNLGIEVLLRERIKTRISQATGRCTRSDTDYAVIIMAGRSLLNFCLRKENQRIFHPELHAELRFAFEQPAENLSNLDEMIKSFLARDSNWEAAEQNIAELRATEQPANISTIELLAAAVQKEVDFSYAFWSEDYENAVTIGRDVVDSLSGDQVSLYRALWCYYVASAAFQASKRNSRYVSVKKDFFQRATSASKTVPWFATALVAFETQETNHSTEETDASIVAGIADFMNDLGFVGNQFQAKLDEIEVLLNSTEASRFERGLLEFGKMAGFYSWKPNGQAAPDCVWQLGQRVAFLLEGKSEESPNDGVSVQNCRQAGGHLSWARTEYQIKDCQNLFSILVSPKSKVDQDAVAHADDIYLWRIPDMLDYFSKLKHLLQEIRGATVELTLEDLRTQILERVLRADLASGSFPETLLSQRLSNVKTK